MTDLFLEVAPMTRPAWADNANVRYVVGVSGGKDSSAVLLYLLYVLNIPSDRIIVTFCDTGNEHAWTYAHIKYIHKHVHPVITLMPELDYFALALDKRRFPSAMARFCTEFLKIMPSQDFIQSCKYRGFDVITVSGVRADESEDRKNKPEWDYSGTLLCVSWRPLISWTLADVLAIHTQFNVPLNPLYALGAQRVGCWPCIMSRKEEIRTIALKFPERIDQIRKAEQEFETRYGRYSSFFAMDKVPERFRTKPFQLDDGTWINVCTIDDVVKWSLTGDKAQGSWEDEPVKEKVNCNSGFCE